MELCDHTGSFYVLVLQIQDLPCANTKKKNVPAASLPSNVRWAISAIAIAAL